MAAKTRKTQNPLKIIANGRLSYAHIFEPWGMEGQEKKYSLSLLIPKDDEEAVTVIKGAISSAVEEGKERYWKGKAPGGLRNPLRDGDEERPDDENYEGMYFINMRSDRAPQVVGTTRGADGKPVQLGEEDVYSGCYANVSVSFYPYDVSGNRGVGAGLGNIQKTADGERFGGASSAEEEFIFTEEEFDDDDIFG